MFGQLEGRFPSALMLASFMAIALPGQVSGQSWELERERGVGGGATSGPSAQTAEANRPSSKVGFEIVVEREDQPIVRPAEGVPVSPFSDEQVTAHRTNATANSKTNALVAVALEEAAAAAAELRSNAISELPAVSAKTRSTPPTAMELLQGSPPKPIEPETVAALPAAPRPAIQEQLLPGTGEPSQEPIEQAQLLPNAGAAIKAIVPPRSYEAPSANKAPSESANAPIVLPAPRKPFSAPAEIEQVLLSPNVGASPKEPVLRTAPAPDNTLVELVETPSDYSLTVSAGSGQILNLGKPITNIFVADPNVADVNVLSPTQIVVHGNQLGRTNIFGLGTGGDVVFAVDVDTVPNADLAQAKLRAASPASATQVSLNSGTLIAEGAVSGVGEAIEVANVTAGLQKTQGPTVNNTTIDGSQQVNLRVRFAEVSRNDVFSLGVNWEALADTGDFLFGLSTGNFLSAGGRVDARDLLSGEEFARFDFTGDFGDVSVDAFIDALQREGIVNILAEPNLTSVNGEPASFRAGGEVPILVPGGGGDGNVTIEYKPFGVSLDFHPTLLPGDRINLRVRPEVSSIANNGGVVLDGFVLPAFNVRFTETSVELASGQTIAIAGLFQRDLTTDTDKYPLLGDVPVLGQLFRSERFQRFETELVILITPYLVKPISNRSVALPSHRLDDQANPLAKQDKRRAGFIVD